MPQTPSLTDLATGTEGQHYRALDAYTLSALTDIYRFGDSIVVAADRYQRKPETVQKALNNPAYAPQLLDIQRQYAFEQYRQSIAQLVKIRDDTKAGYNARLKAIELLTRLLPAEIDDQMGNAGARDSQPGYVVRVAVGEGTAAVEVSGNTVRPAANRPQPRGDAERIVTVADNQSAPESGERSG